MTSGFNFNKEELESQKNDVKVMIRKIRGNENPDEIKALEKEFQDLVNGINPVAIALAEQELMKEGYTFEDLRSACDAHLAIFKGALENSRINVPVDHPIHYFQEEHKGILQLMTNLRANIRIASQKGDKTSAKYDLLLINNIVKKLLESEKE